MNSWKHYFALQASLSKAEKRQFKLMADLHEGEKKYVAAFDEIERMLDFEAIQNGLDPEPDEDALKNRFTRKGIASPLHQVRAYLSRTVFKSLRHLEEGKTKKDEAQMLLQEGILLQRRAFFEAAAQKFEALLALAERYEFFALGTEAIPHLLFIKSQQNLKNYRDQTLGLVDKLSRFSALLKTENDYRILHWRAFLLRRTLTNALSPEVLLELEKLEASPLLLAPSGDGLSFFSKIYLVATKGLLASSRRGFQAAQTFGKAQIELWEGLPHQIEEHPRRYLIAIANYLNSCLVNHDFSDFEAQIAKIKALGLQFYDDEAERFQNLAMLEQLYFLNTGQLERAAALAPEIEKGLAVHRRKINRAREITLRSNIAITFFALDQHEAALEKFAQMFNLGRTEHRPDIQSMAKLLQTILHLELRHDNYIDQLVRNTAQNLRYNEQFFDFERLVLSNLNRLAQLRLKRLPQKAEAAAQQPLLLRFREELSQFSEKTREKHTPGLEEISAWVESRCRGMSFRQVLEEKSQRNRKPER